MLGTVLTTCLPSSQVKQARLGAEYERLQEQGAGRRGGNKRGSAHAGGRAPLASHLPRWISNAPSSSKPIRRRSMWPPPTAELPPTPPCGSSIPRCAASIAEHLINTKRLRSALLKRFSALRAEVLAEEKERLGRLSRRHPQSAHCPRRARQPRPAALHGPPLRTGVPPDGPSAPRRVPGSLPNPV